MLFLWIILFFNGVEETLIYKSEHIKIYQLSEHVLKHKSYIQTQDFGNVGCNGMIVIEGKEAFIIDSPTDNKSTHELITWLRNQKYEVRGIYATHFHKDCVGGLKVFHEEGIPSYAYLPTIDLAKKAGFPVPQNGCASGTKFKVGEISFVASYFGKGHTKDNSVVYVPNDKVLFGGCLLKSLKAGKGNLEDAFPKEWANTIGAIKKAYPTIRFIIPGHGTTGSARLLDYTSEMFTH